MAENRRNLEARELHFYIYARESGICESCGEPVEFSKSQKAHKIKQGKGTREYIYNYVLQKYGKELKKREISDIIHHPLNQALTCSLKCNDKQNIFYKSVQRDALLEEILKIKGVS